MSKLGRKLINHLAAAAAALLLCAHVSAAVAPDEARPKLALPAAAVVKGERISVGEIARIESYETAYSELVDRLKAVDLGLAPAPMVRITIPGIKILETIEQAGIPRDSLAYSIPQAVSVERAGREITPDEVINAVKNSLVLEQGLDLQVREVSWSNSYVIPIGATEIKIERLGLPTSGRMPIRVSVDVDEDLATRFLATARVDDWRAVPVVNRTMERGEMIANADISLVRMNMSDQPADLASDDQTVVGKRTKQRINAGAPLRLSQIDVPPTVAKGSRVTMLFENGGLRVTAVGLALEDGQIGQDLNLKNESSGKTVRGRIIGESMVKVN